MVEAIKFYNKRTTQDSIKSAEHLRRCLEEFLRFNFGNTRGLDKNIDEVGKQLKNTKKAAELRNLITQSFKHLDLYFNENSKHKDGDIAEAENEFLLYQAGLLMRYLYKLFQERILSPTSTKK